MKIKKTFIYSLIVGIILAVIVFYNNFFINGTSLVEAVVSSILGIIIIIAISFFISGFIYVVEKAIFLFLDSNKDQIMEIRNENIKQGEEMISSKTTFVRFLLFMIAFFGILLALYFLQRYLYLIFLDKYLYLHGNELSNIITKLSHKTENSRAKNYEIIIMILSMIEFRLFFYRKISKFLK